MRVHKAAALGALLLAFLLEPAAALANPPLRVVIGLHQRGDTEALVRAFPGATVVRRLRRAVVLDIPAQAAPEGAQRLAQRPNLRPLARWSEPEVWFPVRLRNVPNDPLYPQQWTLHSVEDPRVAPDNHVDAEAAWLITEGLDPLGEPVRVAVVDDGFDLSHPDLRFGPGRDVSHPDPLAWDDDPTYGPGEFHGTLTAGVVAAVKDNGLGGAGICPACQVVAVRLLGDGGAPNIYTSASTVAAAIEWAALEGGAAVINNSWGPPDGNPFANEPQITYPRATSTRPAGLLPQVLQEALLTALTEGRGGKGTLITWSAGNGNELLTYDGFAANPYVLAVGAVDATGERAFYSDYGPPLYMVAPSSGGSHLPAVISTDVSGGAGESAGDYWDRFGGTSASAALVAGAAALVIAAYPDLTAAQVAEALALGATVLHPTHGGYHNGRSPWFGYGRLNAAGALVIAGTYDDACTYGLELCNGRDDDCDGEVDEGEVCHQCLPTEGTEVCDGLDNNCDGRVDEDYVCVPNQRPVCAPCAATADCAVGLQCRVGADLSGSWCLAPCGPGGECGEDFFCDGEVCQLRLEWIGGCSAYGSCEAEICDGLDNDCNGVVDDVSPQHPDAVAASAICAAEQGCPGRQAICIDGNWACEPLPLAAEELCDGVDNNCDGRVDEGACGGCTSVGGSGPLWLGVGLLGCWRLRRRRRCRVPTKRRSATHPLHLFSMPPWR